MKNRKKIIAMIMIVSLVFSVCNTNVVFATEQETTETNTTETNITTEDDEKKEMPDEKDWTDEKNQRDVWDVFNVTDWNNGVNIYFTMGDQGIAFADTIDNYKDYQNVFEAPIIETLKTFEKNEEDGKIVLSNPHAFKLTEYEKIVAIILYSIYVRQGNGLSGTAYSFDQTDADGVSKIDLLHDTMESMIKSLDEDQIHYIEQSNNYYLFKDWENYAKGELGYTDDTVRSSMFREPYVAYFGFYSATKIDLPMLIRRILNELTKHNGMVIEGGTGESEIYEFDPYETKNFLNYLMLDSVLLRGSMSNDLFMTCVKADNFPEIQQEFNDQGSTESGAVTFKGDHIDIPLYKKMYDTFMYNNYDKIYFCQYNKKRMVNTSGYKLEGVYNIMLYVNKESIENCALNDSNDGYLHPGVSDGEQAGIGKFYYSEYKATRILDHKINGVTGEDVSKK